MDIQEVQEQIDISRGLYSRAREAISAAIVGQKKMIDGLFMGMLAGGHVLLEGVPGLAKTLAVKSLAQAIDASFKRIQFTPDLLPADLTGALVYRQQTGEFIPRKGPVFSNIVLADEINRAPAKVQSALLEAMEEKQVTLGDNTYPLPDPFFVLATQNPIDHEGTYPLPEAQLDRFILKILVAYPNAQEELEILRRAGSGNPRAASRVISPEDIRRLQETAGLVKMDERIENYIVSLVSSSREKQRGRNSWSRYIEFGASPRATIYLYRCAKVQAFFEGRAYVVPEDVKAAAPDVLRHRIVLSYEAESDELSADDVIKNLLSAVAVP
ncbi:MAG: MoxR family ATPase [Spirochaetales bacterium]|jgi:MoxR-like ATPase|nr:MoxR family ATPase [Spirochaetales bacterium]